MTRLGFLLGIFSAAIAVLLITIAYSSGTSRWLATAAGALLTGLIVGLLLGRTAKTTREPRTNSQETILSDAGIIDFSPKLLDATINEMREVASNRAARSLFSNIEDSIGARRLTELTRNPAIYDAFLDGVRGKERAGVKVETYGSERRVFDLRVVPLQSPNGELAHGAVGVFFDITRLERLELIRQEFLSNVSHELRTPLTSIIALAETLETGAIDD